MPVPHILVPLDYSASAERSLAYAIAFAKTLQARVTLLHVIDFPQLVDRRLAPYRDRLEADTRRALDACLQRVRDAGVEGDMLRVHGTPLQEIIETAKEIGAEGNRRDVRWDDVMSDAPSFQTPQPTLRTERRCLDFRYA